MSERLSTSQTVIEKSPINLPGKLLVVEIDCTRQDLLDIILKGLFKPEYADLLVPPPIRELKLPQEWYSESEAEQILGRNVGQWIRLRRIKGCIKIGGIWQIPALEIESYFNQKTAAEAANIWGIEEDLVTRALRSKNVQQAWAASKVEHFWRIPLETVNQINVLEKKTIPLSQAQKCLTSHLSITANTFYKLIKDLRRYFDAGEVTALFGERNNLSLSTSINPERDQKHHRGIDIIDFAKLVGLVKKELQIREEWITPKELALLTGFKLTWIQVLTHNGTIQARRVRIQNEQTYRYPPPEVKRIVAWSKAHPPPSRKKQLREAFNKRIKSIRVDESVLTIPVSSYEELTRKQEIQLIILVRQGNKKAIDRFFVLYSPLVRMIARKYYYPDFSIKERLTFGFRGLYMAVIHIYDFKNVFAAYATGAIKHQIMYSVWQEQSRCASLDETRGISLHEIIPSLSQPSVSEQVELKLLQEEIGSKIAHLSEEEKRLTLLIYEEEKTIIQAAKEMGITPEEARSIHERVITILRETLR